VLGVADQRFAALLGIAAIETSSADDSYSTGLFFLGVPSRRVGGRSPRSQSPELRSLRERGRIAFTIPFGLSYSVTIGEKTRNIIQEPGVRLRLVVSKKTRRMKRAGREKFMRKYKMTYIACVYDIYTLHICMDG
jgi:hypothetical protein